VLQILRYALLRMSPAVARWLSTQQAALGSSGSDSTPLYGKNDLAFTDALYKLVRNVFQFIPAVPMHTCMSSLPSVDLSLTAVPLCVQLSQNQFLAPGFAERKIHFLCNIIKMCMAKHNEFRKQFGSLKPKPK
jgi:hypothetical protein